MHEIMSDNQADLIKRIQKRVSKEELKKQMEEIDTKFQSRLGDEKKLRQLVENDLSLAQQQISEIKNEISQLYPIID